MLLLGYCLCKCSKTNVWLARKLGRKFHFKRVIQNIMLIYNLDTCAHTFENDDFHFKIRCDELEQDKPTFSLAIDFLVTDKKTFSSYFLGFQPTSFVWKCALSVFRLSFKEASLNIDCGEEL